MVRAIKMKAVIPAAAAMNPKIETPTISIRGIPIPAWKFIDLV